MLPFSLTAAIVAAIVSIVIGFVWYGPLFAKPWMKHVGLSEKEIGDGPGVGYLITTIAAFVQAAVVGYLIKSMAITDLGNGALFGLLLGLGFVATTFASNYIFAKKSIQLYLIDAGYQVLNIVAAAIVAVLIA